MFFQQVNNKKKAKLAKEFYYQSYSISNEERQLSDAFEQLLEEYVEGNPNEHRQEKLIQEGIVIKKRLDELAEERWEEEDEMEG